MATTLDTAYENYRYYTDVVDSYSQKIRKTEEKYDEILRLKSRFESTQSNFESKQQQRISSFYSRFGGSYQVRVMQAYQNGMGDLLTGAEYRNASGGLNTAIGIIEEKRSALQKEIYDYEDQRATAIERRDYWWNEIQAMNAEETGE